MAALKLVDQQTRSAPYDSLTRANGWRFELDYERLEASDTWALAEPEMRPWLLMLWLTAWKQRPCGSLPNDDTLIAARMGMKLNTFRANREILMRGWWLAEDGKLYHGVLVEQVTSMLGAKNKERDRGRARREAERQAEQNQEVTGNVRVDVQEESGGRPAESTPRPHTGTGTSTNTSKEESPDGDLSTTSVARPDASPPVPRIEIIAAYHRILPMLPEISEWTPARAKALRTRWRESSKRQTVRWWERFFTYVAESKFLTGRADPRPGEPVFVADIDFILRPSKFVSIIEGKYHA